MGLFKKTNKKQSDHASRNFDLDASIGELSDYLSNNNKINNKEETNIANIDNITNEKINFEYNAGMTKEEKDAAFKKFIDERKKKDKEKMIKIQENKKQEKQQFMEKQNLMKLERESKRQKENEKKQEEHEKWFNNLAGKRVEKDKEKQGEKILKQNWNSITSNTKYCATCEYWKGTREVGNISRTSLKYLASQMQGRCHRPGLPLAGESRSATQNCGKSWCKWAMLK